MLPELVIFDCDGVLVDTEPLANESLAEGLRELGFEDSLEDARNRYLGLSWTDVIAEIETRLGAPLPPDWRERREARDRELFATRLKPIPGVDHLVERLRRTGVPYCVASSGSVAKMRFTLGLTGLLHLFEGVLFSADRVERGKPHPDLYLHAAAQMGAAADRTTVIEDSVRGVTGARAAGMSVLAFARDPLSDRAGLRDAGGRLISDMAEVPALIGLT